MSVGDWIILDVGGRRMSTTRSTLISSPGSVLARMFDPDSGLDPARMENGAYIIDANPDCFQVILDWLRYHKVMLPSSLNDYGAVSVVAEYYGLLDMVEHIKTLQTSSIIDEPRDDEKVALDVGGKKMYTTRRTLSVSPVLREMFDTRLMKTTKPQADGSYFIDSDPDNFLIVLNYMRDDVVILPESSVHGTPSQDNLQRLFARFQLHYAKTQIEENFQNLRKARQ
eukprot:TRINITY_DN29402_c0_g1_i1.p1 TRINITY_DN29402_c0_g1~~TRINITY_DN29402_c0_g1_i1.p1  ORF type:complete len:226 (-),score=42.63 TRINITY_DN29402_c0_g1_i1:102-779(-)